LDDCDPKEGVVLTNRRSILATNPPEWFITSPKEDISMKLRVASLSVTALVATAGLTFAAAKVDFSGTWVMDKTRSEGIPPNVEQTMTLTQLGDNLTMHNKIVTAEGDININDTFNLNGKEVEFTQKRNDEEIKGKRTSKWLAEGNSFESTEEFTIVGGDNVPITQQITRKWVMSGDGKTFTVDLFGKTPNGDLHTKRVFIKK
jgi:hypothetical protein